MGYFIVFSIISAMVLLTLFIGVITTSMDEANSNGKEMRETRAAVDKYADQQEIPDIAIWAWNNMFSLMDVDEGGSMDIDEIQLGLTACAYLKPGMLEVIEEVAEEENEDDDPDLSVYEFVKAM